MTPPRTGTPCAVFVINLDSSGPRLENAMRHLRAAGLDAERVPAIDGRLLSDSDIARLCPDNSRHFYAPLSRGEVGCYLSHLKALQAMLDRGLERCVIFEDDFELLPRFGPCLRELLALGSALPDAVKLYGARPRGEVIATLAGGERLVRSSSPPICSTCTLWTQRGARKLLAASTRLTRPIDVQVKHWWEMGLDVAWISPPPVVDCRTLMQDSTIGDRRVRGVPGRLAQLRYRWGYALARQRQYLHAAGAAGWIRSLARVPHAIRRDAQAP